MQQTVTRAGMKTRDEVQRALVERDQIGPTLAGIILALFSAI